MLVCRTRVTTNRVDTRLREGGGGGGGGGGFLEDRKLLVTDNLT